MEFGKIYEEREFPQNKDRLHESHTDDRLRVAEF